MSTATKSGAGLNRLCLLSLDGGGVRGLSTLFILKFIMKRLNGERQKKKEPTVRPCEVFDLIGGTSTGGLIAIMLGRLEMDVDECISAYTELMKTILKDRSPFSFPIRSKFDSGKLRDAVLEILRRHGATEKTLLRVEAKPSCKVFVCARTKQISRISRLRSYDEIDEIDNFRPTILEAALATSAATGFFDPVPIRSRSFVDGALGANNPVNEVEMEASNIWCPETGDVKPLVKCFISIGTGDPGLERMKSEVSGFLLKTLVDIVTDAEQTEETFADRWAGHPDNERYFRFNVSQGLQDVGLAEYEAEAVITTATEEYIRHRKQKLDVLNCVQNLSQKQCTYIAEEFRRDSLGTCGSWTDVNLDPTGTQSAVVFRDYFHRSVELRTPRQSPPLFTVPFPRDPDFIARETLLDQIYQKCSQPASRVALVGLGGVGKSQLVIEFAHRIHHDEKHSSTCILWIHASSAARFQQSCYDIIKQAKIEIPDDLNNPEVNPFQHLCHWLRDEWKDEWILIFDSVDDDGFLHEHPKPRLDSQANGQHSTLDRPLIQYLPTSSIGTTIITTRNNAVARRIVEESGVIPVSEMEKSTARELFEKKLGVQESGKEVSELVDELGKMPLAIVQAASYIKRKTQMSVQVYLKEFRKSDDKKFRRLAEKAGLHRRDWQAQSAIIITLQMTLDSLHEESNTAANLLFQMSFYDGQGIADSLLFNEDQARNGNWNEVDENGEDEHGDSTDESSVDYDRLGDIETLRDYSLISVIDDGKSYTMHQLVQLATRIWLKDHRQLEQWKQNFIKNLSGIFPKGKYENWLKCQTLFPHAQSAMKHKPVDEDGGLREWALLLYNAAVYAKNVGKIAELKEMATGSMKAREKLFGPENVVTLGSKSMVSLAHYNGGNWKEAEHLQTQVLETAERQLGEDHPVTLNSMTSLAATYAKQGRWEKAEHLQMQVLEKRKKTSGENHPDTLTSVNNLALTYAKQGRWCNTRCYLGGTGTAVTALCHQQKPSHHHHHIMATIANTFKKCRDEFATIIVSPRLSDHASEVRVQEWKDEFGRLLVWAGNIGAQQTRQSSLDYRLRDASHIKEQIINLLQGIQELITDLADNLDEEEGDLISDHQDQDGDSPDDDDGSTNSTIPTTEIQQIYQGIVETITQLYQMSMLIRNPANHDRLIGMDKLDAEPFRPWALQHISNKFPNAENTAAQRISAAMARQRAILKYRERHHAKLSDGVLQDDEKSTMLSETVVSHVFAEGIEKHDDISVAGASETSYGGTLLDGEDGEAPKIPRMPKAGADQQPFECPFCFYIITIRDRKSWARHVFRDLMPYVCIFNECSTPDRLYESRREWFHHIQSAHASVLQSNGEYQCSVCKNKTFSEKSFQRHLSQHLEELSLFFVPRLDDDDNGEETSDEGDKGDKEKDILDNLSVISFSVGEESQHMTFGEDRGVGDINREETSEDELVPKSSKPEDLENTNKENNASLKDEREIGILPGARWTKIDRRLVNPEALNSGHERFEERSDSVVVLRVLSKEEISSYVRKTEIRDARDREMVRSNREQNDQSQETDRWSRFIGHLKTDTVRKA